MATGSKSLGSTPLGSPAPGRATGVGPGGPGVPVTLLGHKTSQDEVVTPEPPYKMAVAGVQVAVEGDVTMPSEAPVTLLLSTKLRVGGKWVIKVGSQTASGDTVIEGTPRLRVTT